MKLSEQRSSMLHGVMLIALFACAAFYIGGMDWVKALSLSPMVVGIILGMLYANSLRNNLPDTWVPGIKFCSKRVLRTGIILYGFKTHIPGRHGSRHFSHRNGCYHRLWQPRYRLISPQPKTPNPQPIKL